jgi:NAD(P)-dependent dehydrogenase (short-subunit alcohol dehydrogenase family)
MPLESLENRNLLVLGGSSGMGYAVAAHLLRSKAVVTIAARTPDKLEAARQTMLAETGAPASHLRAVPTDALDAAGVEAAVALAANAAGEIDGAFVVAGGGGFMPVQDVTPQFAADEFANNVFPIVNTIAACFPRMKRAGGSIVALSSAAAAITYPRLAAYGAAKAALDHYVRVAADELGEHKIRVNCVRSGFTRSAQSDALIADAQYVAEFARITPLGPYGQPEDFGAMVALLLSPDSSWITGQVFGIDGGLTLRGYGGGVYPSGS